MQHRYRRFVLRRGIAEPFGYFVHDFAAADRAVQVGKGFRVGIDAGVGKILTAGFAAGAAVGLR